MPRLAYARSAYARADLPEMRVVNQYVEASPANPGDNAVLLGRPGLVPLADIGPGPIRGLLAQPGIFNGDVFTVSGPALYRGSSFLNTVGGDGRVCLAATTNVVMVANDTGLQIYDGAGLAAVAFPDGAGVSVVGYIAGYAYAVRAGTRRIYFTLDPTTWDALDYFSAEQDTGAIVGAPIVSDQLWVFCERITEVFQTTGDPNAPFQRVEGRVYDKGCISRDTIVKADNSVFWVGNDRIVYRGDSTPVRISNHGIEERLARSATDVLGAWLFVWNGHVFYVLTTSDGSFGFDAATQEWSEFASYGRPSWRAWVGVFADGANIAGDDELGRLWSFSDASSADAGEPIERIFTAMLSGSTPMIVDSLTLDARTGNAPTYEHDPIIEMRSSRDAGRTWSDWRPTTLAQRGNYRGRPVWRRCGMIDTVTVFEFRTTDATPWRLSAVRANDPTSGRSR